LKEIHPHNFPTSQFVGVQSERSILAQFVRHITTSVIDSETMGRRKLGSRPIGQIRILIGPHVEVFDLDNESLSDRPLCVQRAASLHEAAISYLHATNEANHQHQSQPPEPEPVTIPAVRSAGLLAATGNSAPNREAYSNDPESDPWNTMFDWNFDQRVKDDLTQPTWGIKQYFLNDP
jgi:hypothetical protein